MRTSIYYLNTLQHFLHSILYSTLLYSIAQHSLVLALSCTLQDSTLQYSTLLYSLVLYSTLQHYLIDLIIQTVGIWDSRFSITNFSVNLVNYCFVKELFVLSTRGHQKFPTHNFHHRYLHFGNPAILKRTPLHQISSMQLYLAMVEALYIMVSMTAFR